MAPALSAYRCISHDCGVGLTDPLSLLDARRHGRYGTRLRFSQFVGLARGAPRDDRKKIKGFAMARRCELTGKGPIAGNNVSHANNRTKRRFLPNLCKVTLHSDKLGEGFKFKVAASTLRSVDHVGGLDVFLAKAKDDQLSTNALKLKRKLAKASA